MNSENKTEEKLYYLKLVYIIASTIICFLGILIIFENSNLILGFLQNKTENLVLLYIVYCSFSWLLLYFFAEIIYKIVRKNKKNIGYDDDDGDLELKNITKHNTALNKSNYLIENMIINDNFKNNSFENKNMEFNNLDKYKEKITSNNNNITQQANDLENSNNNIVIHDNNNRLWNYMKDSESDLKLIYFIIMLINYSLLAFLGVCVFVKVLEEKVFKNYKLHYKIYLFLLLSLSKSSIIVIGFIYKFVSKKIESNLVKFELNEEFLRQIEREIQEANKISGVISPDKNLIKSNEMFKRQDLNKKSNFILNESLNNNEDLKLHKNSTEYIINEKEKNKINTNLNFTDDNSRNENEKKIDSNNLNNLNEVDFNFNNDKAKDIFNFQIKEKAAEAKKDINLNDSEERNKKVVNFKMNSDFNFNLNKDKDAIEANCFKNIKENEEKPNSINYRNSFSNELFNSKKNILTEDDDIFNSKINLEKINPSKLIYLV